MESAAIAALHTARLPPVPPNREGQVEDLFIHYLFTCNVSDRAACRFRDRWSP